MVIKLRGILIRLKNCHKINRVLTVNVFFLLLLNLYFIKCIFNASIIKSKLYLDVMMFNEIKNMCGIDGAAVIFRSVRQNRPGRLNAKIYGNHKLQHFGKLMLIQNKV